MEKKEVKYVTLRIKPGTLELPHTVRKYEFKPDAKVPEPLALGLLKTHPEIYEEAKGKADLEKYTFKKTFQVNEIQKVLDELTDEGRADVYEYASKILEAEGEEKKPAKEEEKKPAKEK